MPLDMPESVLVRFSGKLRPGVTLRDAVNAIPLAAIRKGLLTVAKKGKKNVFNGRILEMEGLEDLTVEQAYELTDASAERSAAGGVIALDAEKVAAFLRSNIALMRRMIEEGYRDAGTLEGRIRACEAWLKDPVLLKRDAHAGVCRGPRDRPGRDHGADPGLPERPGRRQAALGSLRGRGSTRSSSARA